MINLCAIQGIVAGINKRFKEEVVPLIKSGDFSNAYKIMDSRIMKHLQLNSRDITFKIHCGLSYLEYAESVCEDLKSEREPVCLEEFLAYSAQTTLPNKIDQ